MEFVKQNLNPKGWKTGDCVVRAIANANHTSWESTYLALCDIGAEKCRMPNEKHTYEALLKEYGWIKQKMPRHEDGSRFTVRELVEQHNGPMVISMAKHLTYAINNTIYDLWDCGSKSVSNYWTKNEKGGKENG